VRQAVGIKEVHDDAWLVSFMDYELRLVDVRGLEPLTPDLQSTQLSSNGRTVGKQEVFQFIPVCS
jgi:hypothetical protein